MEEMKKDLENMTDAAEETVAEAAETAEETVAEVKETVEETVENAEEAVQEAEAAVEAAEEKVEEAAEKVEEAAEKQLEEKETKQLEKETENPPVDAHASYLEKPLEVPDLCDEPDRTPKPYPYVKDQVHFAIENMLKELAIGLSWLRDEDMDKAGELLEMLENGCERASKLIKAGGKK